MSKKKSNVKVRSSVQPPPSLLIGILRAPIISLSIGVLILLIVCAVLLTTEDPGAYASSVAAILPFPCALLCGILSAKQSTLGGLASGALGGTVFCLLLLLLGSVMRGSSIDAAPTALGIPVRAGICLLLSAVSSYAVTHQKPKSRRRYHP